MRTITWPLLDKKFCASLLLPVGSEKCNFYTKKEMDKQCHTSGHVDKVVARRLVDFNVSGTDVVLVPLECHVAVFGRNESDERLAVSSTLSAEAECNSSPVVILTILLLLVRTRHHKIMRWMVVTGRQHHI